MSQALPVQHNDHPLPIARYRFSARAIDARATAALRRFFAARAVWGGTAPSCLHDASAQLHPTAHCAAPAPYTRIFEAAAPEQHQLQRFSAIPNAYVVEPPPPALNTMAHANDRWLPAGQKLRVSHGVDRLCLGAIAPSHRRLATRTGAWLDQEPQSAGARASAMARFRGAVDPGVDSDQSAHPTPRCQSEYSPLPTATQALQLHIHTPLRLQHQGHALPPSKLTPRTLISHLARRAALMLNSRQPNPLGHPSARCRGAGRTSGR